MNNNDKFKYTTLEQPTLISEQDWNKDIVPIVSISCITYNHGNFIRDAIEGFLMQKTTFPVEILIHDDASTDGTTEIIKEYEAKYPRLCKCFYEAENTWNKPNRRELWKPFLYARRGKYIALCEGDDYWTEPLKLQKQVEFLEGNEEYVAVAENGIVHNSITKKEYLFSEEPERDVTIAEMIERRRFPTASVVFRKETIKDFNKDTKQSNDTILWCYLASKGKFRYFNKISSVYNRGNHGLVEGTDKLKWAKIVEGWNNELIRLFGGRYFNKQIAKDAVWVHYWDVFKKNQHLGFTSTYYVLLKCFSYNWKLTTIKMFSKMMKPLEKGLRTIARIIIRNQNTRTKIEKLYRKFFPKNKSKQQKYPPFYVNVSNSGISKTPRSPKLIVTLTSFPPRIKTLHLTINTLLNQTLKPDMLILWLAHSQFPRKEKDLPRKLLRLRKYGLTINWCEDIKSYKKLIPALEKYPTELLVTADDDIFYPENWLEMLYVEYVKNPDIIHCHRAHLIRIQSGSILPYKIWEKSSHIQQISNLLFCTTGAGAIFKKSFFHRDVLRVKLFMELSPTADDVWFWAMSVLNDVPVSVLENGYSSPVVILELQDSGLFRSLNSHGENDRQIAAVVKHYHEILIKLLQNKNDTQADAPA